MLILVTLCCHAEAKQVLSSSLDQKIVVGKEAPILSDSITEADLQKALPGDRTMGRSDAPIVMISYASMTCWHCASFSKDVMPIIEKKYIDTGKVFFIYRDFPLDYRALQAAILGLCYNNNIDYFQYHRAVFENIENWPRKPQDLSLLASIAKTSRITDKDFHRCMNDKQYVDYIIQQKYLAHAKLAIDSTPTFLINGTKYSGFHDSEFFDQKFAELLSK